MKKALIVIMAILVAIPIHYLGLRDLGGKTIVLSGVPHQNMLVIVAVNIFAFGLLFLSFWRTLLQSWQLVPVLLLIMYGYVFVFGVYVYEDIMEHRIFSGAGKFSIKEVRVIGTTVTPSKSGPNYDALLDIPELGTLHPRLPITEELRNLILDNAKLNKDNPNTVKSSCLLKTELQQVGAASRIVYLRALGVADMTGC
jgi:hypothetical protein